MRKRIYWLLPDLKSARATMDDLLLAHIEERHIHFVAREGTDMRGLHAANVLQTSDVVRSAEIGLLVGAGLGGLLGALVAVFYPIVGDEAQLGLVVPGLAIFGALFGIWTSTMIGISTPSKRLQRFAAHIERGQVLAKPGSIKPHTKFEAEVYILSKEEGGRHTPFFSGYRPQFYFRTTDVTGSMNLPEGVEMIMPGDNIKISAELIAPIAMEQGLRFAIREGGHTVGAGVVARVIE